MADFLSGTLPPPSTSTTTTTREMPKYYTDYVQNIANFGTQAAEAGGVAGFSPLQTQAFGAAPTLAFSGSETAGMGQGFIGQAGQALTPQAISQYTNPNASAFTNLGVSGLQQAGQTLTPNIIQQYMNPYTQGVVDEMARLQQRNIQERVIPGLKGAMGATGQFGSQRQAQVAGQTMRDMQADLLGRQLGALQQGYGQALGAAQTDLSRIGDVGQAAGTLGLGFEKLGSETAISDLDRILKAGTAAGNLAGQQQDIAKSGLDTLSKLGAIEQAQGQKILDYPMEFAAKYAGLLAPYAGSIPTTTTEQETGVRPNIQYGPSEASQLAGLLTGLGSFLYGPYGANAPTSGQGGSGFDLGEFLGGLGNFFLTGNTSGGTQTPAPIEDRSQPATSGRISNRGPGSGLAP